MREKECGVRRMWCDEECGVRGVRCERCVVWVCGVMCV